MAYLEVPSFVQNRHVTREAFAGHIQALMADLRRGRPAGWIVDLRRNGGGDMWPMLAGPGPLLGGGPFGSFVSARSFAWSYRDGATLNDGRVMCRAGGKPTVIGPPAPKVAVLLGPGTASAGEAVALAFREGPDALSFGQPTAGQATANTSHVLEDGAILALTAALMADRSGATYLGSIPPDIVVPVSEDVTLDPTLDAAAAWLPRIDGGRERPGSRG